VRDVVTFASALRLQWAVAAERPIYRHASSALLVVVGSLFVALCAQLALQLPFSPVPITAQTFAVLVVGAVLGRRIGSAALVAYVAEGLVGLPVFAPGVSAGPARLISPTGGYLVGFVLAAWLVGWLAESGWCRRAWTAAPALVLGTLAIYAAGLVGLAAYMPLTAGLTVGVYPFLIGDVLKVGLATLVVSGRRPAV
jgi:biotin transport system substrate-specific component